MRQAQDAFAQLAAFPGPSWRSAENESGASAHDVGSHAVFYREVGDGVLILAVLHQRMRPDLHL
jgi:plasmid stabilization system protein ParE